MTPFLEALFLQAGYNAALVTLGATFLGFAAGSSGTFLYLRKRALVSDAVAHATLPGVGLAFIFMVLLGGDGRNLIGLLAGSAITACAGLVIIEWISRRTRLPEDAAIGAVLGVFFGSGIVILTIIQTMSAGRQAGLESFLLGSTAGMLYQDAVIISIGGFLSVFFTWLMRRPLTLVAFDQDYASAIGYNIRQIDLIMMGIVLAVTVIGMKLVGLILIVAMLIIPPVAARFWTNRSYQIIWIAGAIGAISGFMGAVLSASAPALPTGPIIVLVASTIFIFSFLFAPERGIFSAIIQFHRFKANLHRRQGLLMLARGQLITNDYTIRLLTKEELLSTDGIITDSGKNLMAKVFKDERRWEIARTIYPDQELNSYYNRITPIEDIFTNDEIAEFDLQLNSYNIIGE
jgi:manganese/zinc/iron transport system permease protein